MTKLCPSHSCAPDTLLLGIVQADGTVALSAERFPITADFVEAAKDAGAPETRFRFAGPCREAGCAQWKSGKCGIPDRARKALSGKPVPPVAAPPCAIRADCRWFAQEAYAACALCPFVTTGVPPKAGATA